MDAHASAPSTSRVGRALPLLLLALMTAGLSASSAAASPVAELKALAELEAKLGAKTQVVETYGEDKTLFNLAGDARPGVKATVTLLRRPMCEQLPRMCQAGDPTRQAAHRTSFGLEVVEAWTPYRSNAQELGVADVKDGEAVYAATPPTPASLTWVIPGERLFAKLTVGYSFDDEGITREQARKDLEELTRTLHAGMKAAGLAADQKGEVTSKLPRLPNDCKEYGVSDEDFDWLMSQADLRRSFVDMLLQYEHKHGVSLEAASTPHRGFAPWHFSKLGAHLFTKSHEKVQTFNTAKKDQALAALVTRKYPDGGLTPAKLLEEALLLNEHCLYDALLNCHNYVKREAYALRERRQRLPEMEALYEAQVARYEALPEARKSVLSLEQATGASRKARDEARNALANAPLTRSFVPLRRDGDNEGALYHLFGTMMKGYAERENLTMGFMEAGADFAGGHGSRTNLAASLGVGLEHYGKNLYYRRSFDIKDKVEACMDQYTARLGYELHRLLPGQKGILERRIEELGQRDLRPYPYSVRSEPEGPASLKDDVVSALKRGFSLKSLF